MSQGKLQCIGKQQHLKNKFGGGYKLQINFDPQNEMKVTQLIQSNFPNFVETGIFKGTREYRIQKNEKNLLIKVFEILENYSIQVGITDWSFSQVGLAEIFQTIMEKDYKKKSSFNHFNIPESSL